MAAGDLTWFNQAKVNLGLGLYDLNADQIMLAFVPASVTPAATDADPHFGGTGTTNLATSEATGTNFPAGGTDITNTFVAGGSGGVLDGNNLAFSSDGSNPSDIRWAIGYNNTDANKRALFFIDLGATRNPQISDINVNWNASGISTVT